MKSRFSPFCSPSYPKADSYRKLYTAFYSKRKHPVESVKVILHVALPPLPELRDDWPESLKEKWFETYNLALKTGKGIGD
jgi:hypothetical protein